MTYVVVLQKKRKGKENTVVPAAQKYVLPQHTI